MHSSFLSNMSSRKTKLTKEEQIQRVKEVLNSDEFAEPCSPTRKAIIYKERQYERNYPEISIANLCKLVGCTTTKYYRKLAILRNGFAYEDKARFHTLNKNESILLVSTLAAAAERGECICLDKAVEIGNKLIALRVPAFQMGRSLSRITMRRWVREQNLIVSRAVKMNVQYVSSRLAMLRLFLNLNHLMKSEKYPRDLIINMDEVCFPTDSDFAQGFVIHPSYLPPLRMHSPGSSFVTLAMAVTASGDVLTPSFVTPMRVNHLVSKKFFENGPICFLQPSGFMTGNVFIQWIEKVLCPYIESKRTDKNQHVLLICRSYASRANICVVNVLKKYNIDLLILPTHAVARVQPLTLGVLPSFHKEFDKLYKGSGDVMNILANATYSFKKAMTAENVKKGWTLSHLFDSDYMPFVDKFPEDVPARSVFDDSQTNYFIPCTPMHP